MKSYLTTSSAVTSALLVAAIAAPKIAFADVSDAEFNALKARLADVETTDSGLRTRVAELEKQESSAWLTTERTAEISRYR